MSGKQKTSGMKYGDGKEFDEAMLRVGLLTNMTIVLTEVYRLGFLQTVYFANCTYCLHCRSD